MIYAIIATRWNRRARPIMSARTKLFSRRCLTEGRAAPNPVCLRRFRKRCDLDQSRGLDTCRVDRCAPSTSNPPECISPAEVSCLSGLCTHGDKDSPHGNVSRLGLLRKKRNVHRCQTLPTQHVPDAASEPAAARRRHSNAIVACDIPDIPRRASPNPHGRQRTLTLPLCVRVASGRFATGPFLSVCRGLPTAQRVIVRSMENGPGGSSVFTSPSLARPRCPFLPRLTAPITTAVRVVMLVVDPQFMQLTSPLPCPARRWPERRCTSSRPQPWVGQGRSVDDWLCVGETGESRRPRDRWARERRPSSGRADPVLSCSFFRRRTRRLGTAREGAIRGASTSRTCGDRPDLR